MLVCIRQKSNVPGALYRGGKLPLVASLGSGNATGDNLPSFRDEAFEKVKIFIVNLGDTFCSETAILATSKIA
jgi:hypothetical protein